MGLDSDRVAMSKDLRLGRLLPWLALVAALVVVVALGVEAARTPAAPEPAAAAPEPPAAARPVPEPAAVPGAPADGAEVADLERRIFDLEAALALERRETVRAEERARAAEDEAARLRRELEAERDAAFRRLAVSPPRPAAAPPPGVEVLGSPSVTVTAFGAVLVSGFAINRGNGTESGWVEVTLSGGGAVLGTDRVLLSLQPGQRERYDVTFGGVLPVGPVSATARWRR